MTDDPFVTHRGLLFTVAYEMLGSAVDAEDTVQETWLRWAGVDQAEVRDPRAYLVRIVTRQALNRLRTVSRRREEYVGEWLPEPLLTSPDLAEDVRTRREHLNRHAHGAGDPRPDRAGCVRAARGVRDALRRDRSSAWARHPPRSGRSHTAPVSMSRRGGRGCRWTGPNSMATRRKVHGRRLLWRPPRDWWRSSPRTWC